MTSCICKVWALDPRSVQLKVTEQKWIAKYSTHCTKICFCETGIHIFFIKIEIGWQKRAWILFKWIDVINFYINIQNILFYVDIKLIKVQILIKLFFHITPCCQKVMLTNVKQFSSSSFLHHYFLSLIG